MKIIIALIMGFLAGLLPYLIAGLLPTTARILILLAVWLASSYLLQRGAKTAAQALGRGFLLGAAEWLLLLVMALVYVIFAAPERFPGLIVRGAILAFMSTMCFAGFAAVQIWRRVSGSEAAASKQSFSAHPRS